jgi:gliding motility-associated-like protein
VACFTITTLPNTNIGTSSFTMLPNVAGGLTDFLFGYCYINTAVLPPATYTVTYHFSGSHCPGGTTSTFVFTIANPYNAVWTAPAAMCSNAACVNLTPTLSGAATAGGTWSGTGVSATNFCASVSGAGNFPVTYSVGSSATCNATQTHTITVNAVPTISTAAPTYTVCQGGNVVISASAAGGASTFTWTPSTNLSSANSQTPTFTSGSTTAYTVTGSSAAGCVTSAGATTTVTVVAPPTMGVTSSTYTMCTGGSVVIGANGASTYTWSPAGSLNNANSQTPTASPGSTTVYTVNGTSAGGCVSTTPATTTVSLVAPPTLTMTTSAYTVCPGGTVGISVGGASTYTWSPAGSLNNANSATPNATPGSTTVYTVNGTNAGGCVSTTPATATVTVDVPPTLTMTTSAYTVCPGGTVGMSVGGASTYTWSPAGSLNNANSATPNATPGATTVYTVTGTDGSGCAATSSATATVTVNTPPTLTMTTSAYTVCPGGTVGISVGGASTYTWTPGGSLNNPNSATPNSTPGATTVYTVTGSDANGCAASAPATATVTVNTPITPTITAAPASLCPGGTTTLTAIGVSTCTWSANLGSVTTTTASITPVGTDTYSVNGTDVSGCALTTGTLVVAVSGALSVTITPTNATLCTGTTETLTASGATNYTWMPGGFTTPTIPINPTVNTTYSLTGDNGGCSGSTTLIVTVTPTPTLVIGSPSSTYSVCSGGTVGISVSGASTYTWSPASDLSNANSANPTFTAGSTTIYTVNGTDANGCTAASAATATVTVHTPVTPTITASPSALCTGGTTTLTAAGVSTCTWSANAGSVTTTTVSVSPVATDTYSVNGTDVSGCAFTTGTISVTVSGALSPTITSTSGASLCSGQTTTLTASGATTYTWLPSGATTTVITASPTSNTTYTLIGDNGSCSGQSILNVTVTASPTLTPTSSSPAGICSGQTATLTASGATTYTWMPGSVNTNTISVNPVITTNYTVSGTDVAGFCSSQSVITVSVTATPTLTATSSSSGTVCAGSSITLMGSGAATYTWLPGPIFTGTTTVSPATNTDYTLTAANGICPATPQVVSVTVTPLPSLTVTPSASSMCSNDPPVIITAGGATNYTWMPGGANTNTISVSPGTTTIYTLTGDNGTVCTNFATTTITVTPSPSLTLTTSAGTGTICSGQNVTLTAGGATNYTWLPSGITTTVITDNPATSTTYTLIGANGGGACSASTTTLVTVNVTPTITAVGTINPSLCGVPNGGVSAISVTGTGPFSYQWYNGSTPITGATANSLSGVSIGTYSVLVTDLTTGCTTGIPSIIVPGTLPPIALISPHSTHGQAPVSVTFSNSTTGVGPLTYTWDFGNGTGSSAQNASITYANVGTYTVVMTAYSNGCPATDTAIVIVDAATSIIIPNIFSPNGDGLNDVFMIATTGMKSLNCDIYNRWGTKMFTLSAPNQVWDGKTPGGADASEGTYFYLLNAVGYDGKTYTYQGPLTLVR